MLVEAANPTSIPLFSRQLTLVQLDTESMFVGDHFRVDECQPIVPTDEFLRSVNGMDSYYPAADQNSDAFRTDLSWDDWLSLGLVAEPGFTLPQDCPIPNNSASGCPSLDSNASSDQSINQAWPINFQEDPLLNYPSCPQTTLQQDIESCIPHVPQPSPLEPLPSTTSASEAPSANTKKTVSPTKRKHGPRTKPDQPAKEPVAKKETKTKPAPSTRTAHSIIEHNYRKNLNTKMEQLRQILSTADDATAKRADANEGDNSDGSIEDNKATTITRKSDVLIHAYGYVKRSEREKKSMADENAFLKRRLVALEKLVKCEDCSLLKQMNMLRMGGSGGGISDGVGVLGV